MTENLMRKMKNDIIKPAHSGKSKSLKLSPMAGFKRVPAIRKCRVDLQPSNVLLEFVGLERRLPAKFLFISRK